MHCIYVYLYMLPFQNGKRKPRNFFPLNPFTVCSSYKQKFVLCPLVDKETNGSCPFANRFNGLNGLNGLAHLWKQATVCGLWLKKPGVDDTVPTCVRMVFQRFFPPER